MKTTYTPHPIDASDVVLPEELISLTSLLASNVHDQWSLARIKDGWSYGPQRNDEKKETPCLVPYEELPESEAEYDKITAMNTLKIILKLGYKIETIDK